MLFLIALTLIGTPTHALTADHETFAFLGWNRQCAFAFGHYAYPVLGEALAAEPIQTRVGTLTIDPDGTEPKESLALSLTGAFSWAPDQDRKARAKLAKDGYGLAGFVETLRDAPVVDQRDLPRLINSTDTYRAEGAKWLSPPWRPSTVYYSPFASECAMMLYTRGSKPFYKMVLFRIGNPTARDDRADAHVTNGLLLLEAGDSLGALAEEEIAATMAPEFGPARFHHAALLVLNGRFEPAIDELQAAIAIDPKYKKQARGDPNFDGLYWHPRFNDLTK